mmetsp:Transcript_5591/g.8587  ORF Transcript_5591/g.8587 Transcript_5591/m.8587 type:complete len:82 (+) Transcript_5591:1305-1550(+)
MKGNYLNKWLTRVLHGMDFTDRKTSISQKIPENWKQVALSGVERIRNLFKSHGIKRIFSADETNVKFHEITDKLLAPKGTK